MTTGQYDAASSRHAIGDEYYLHAYTPTLIRLTRCADSALHQETRSRQMLPPRPRGLLTEHLASSVTFARLADQAQRLRRLQTLLEAMLPLHLASAARIANLKRGKVVIHADSGAVAVKLRQMTPRLTAGFVQQGQEVSGIEVRVQPVGRISFPSRKVLPRKLGLQAKHSLTSLAAGLPEDSPLRAAIARLIASAEGKNAAGPDVKR